MLSRTADNLYWLARYVERAEYLARILDATYRLTALPLAYVGASNEWESAVATAGCARAFFAAYAEANEETVTEFLAFSTTNPSSIRNCIETARVNARAVRTALTIEMWDTINGAWLELKKWGNGPRSREEFARFLRWVQESSLRFDGSAYRTMLRNDAYWFSRLGVYHRARRQHRAHPRRQISPVAARATSRSAARSTTSSGRRSCARCRRSPPITGSIARTSSHGWSPTCLMLRDEMPRSLASCYENLVQNLDRIAARLRPPGAARSGRRAPIRARLENQPHRGDFPDRPARIHRRISSRTTTGSAPRSRSNI